MDGGKERNNSGKRRRWIICVKFHSLLRLFRFPVCAEEVQRKGAAALQRVNPQLGLHICVCVRACAYEHVRALFMFF